ncbi:hypothetical protein EJB05_26221, partial [Eragrostis curvula]
MRTLAGHIARQQVSLLLPNIGCLSEEAKWELFDDYVMPTLEFTDDMKPLAFKEIMKVIAHAWRTHKSNLVNNFMLKGIEPFSKHKYIKPEVWTEFVQMKSTEEFLLESEKFKNLQAQNVHNHHLGTAGYDGKIAQWEAQDAKFAKKGIENPWNRYPPDRPQYFLRGRSETSDSGEIIFKSHQSEQVSEKILEMYEAGEGEGSYEGVNGYLSVALGNDEHGGRLRACNSYDGWKRIYPRRRNCKRAADINVDQLKDDLRSELKSEVTREVIAHFSEILAAQGLQIVPISPGPSPIGARKSSCASQNGPGAGEDNDAMMDVSNEENPPPAHEDEDSIDLLTGPTPCSLMLNVAGHIIKVGRGQVHPKQDVIHCAKVREGYVVVRVDYVHADFVNELLEVAPNDEITTLGEAPQQRIQWRRTSIVLRPLPFDHPSYSRSAPSGSDRRPDNSVGQQAQEPRQNGNGVTTHQEKEKSMGAVVQQKQCFSDGIVLQREANKRGDQLNKSKSEQDMTKCVEEAAKAEHEKATKAEQEKAKLAEQEKAKKAEQEKAKKAQQEKGKKAQQDKGKKSEVGKMTSKTDKVANCQINVEPSKKKDVPDLSHWTAQNRGFKPGQPMMSAKDLEEAGHACVALHKFYMDSWKDNETMSFSLPCINMDKEFVVDYLAKALSRFAKAKDYIMAWTQFLSITRTNKKGKAKLYHSFKFPCHQQASGETCGFYVAHHMILTTTKVGLTRPEDFKIPTGPIPVEELGKIWAKTATFLMSQVISTKGEFHYPNSSAP